MIVSCLLVLPSLQAEEPVDCQVVYHTTEGFYVDVGSAQGIQAETSGWVEWNGRQIARVRVVSSTKESSFLQFISDRPSPLPQAGDDLRLLITRVVVEEKQENQERSPTLKELIGDKDHFIPLLAPDVGEVGVTESKNLFHGRVSVRQMYQAASLGQLDYARTRVRTSGSYERIDGTAWALEWSIDGLFRQGDVLEDYRASGEARVRHLALFRRFDDRSFVRMGRFLPKQLPGVRYIDGVHGELAITDSLRVGGMTGFRPTRDYLVPDGNDQAFVAYTSFEAGSQETAHYSGTLGVLFSLYEFEPDRLAVLLDQTFRWGGFSLYSSSEIDVDVGAALFDESVDLTRLDLRADYRVAKWLALRAGVVNHERPDTRSERDSIILGNLNVEDFFQTAFSRYFVGATQWLPGKIRLDERIGYTDSTMNDATHWTVSASRSGLPGFPTGSVTLSVFNLEGFRQDGLAGRVSAYLPFKNSKLSLQPSVSFRFVTADTTGANFFDPIEEDVSVTDFQLRVQWKPTRAWSVSSGVAYSLSDTVDRIYVDVGVTFRW